MPQLIISFLIYTHQYHLVVFCKKSQEQTWFRPLFTRGEVTMFYPRRDSDFPATKIMGNRESDIDLIDIYWNKRILGSRKKEPLKKENGLG
jgi:hypothetical protein